MPSRAWTKSGGVRFSGRFLRARSSSLKTVRCAAVSRLNPAPDFLLIDAVPLNYPLPQRPLIKGDMRCHAIAAASIIAKVERDANMRVWDEVFPGYGLASHKGYSTPEHYHALEQLGPTPLHRLSFEPVRAHSRFPVHYTPQLDLFDTAGAA
jgi:ribonuclease HII